MNPAASASALAAHGRQSRPAGSAAAAGGGPDARVADARPARHADAAAHRRGRREGAARRAHRLSRQPGRAGPAPGGRGEAVARQRSDLRPGPRNPRHRRRDGRHLHRPGRADSAGRRRAAARSDLRCLRLADRPLGRPAGAGAVRDSRRAGSSSIARRSKQRYTPRSRVLLLNTPWNPVGTVFTRERAEPSSWTSPPAHDLLVISDEIYETLVYDGRRHVSPAALSADARARTVLVNSLSKTYGMTGWRVGYCAAPAEIIRAMLLVLQQFSRGPATFVQHAAAAALACAIRRACARWPRSIKTRRDSVLRALQRDYPAVEPLVREGGLFVMVDVRGLGLPSDEVRRFLLHEAGVVVIHGAAYGGRRRHVARLVRGRRRDAGARTGTPARRAATLGGPCRGKAHR